MEIKNTVDKNRGSDLLKLLDSINEIGILVNKSHAVLDDLNIFLEKDPDCYSESDFSALLVGGYEKAQLKGAICTDYICQAAQKLQELYNGYYLKYEMAKGIQNEKD